MPENLETATQTRGKRITDLVNNLTVYISTNHVDPDIMCDAIVDAVSLERQELYWSEMVINTGNPNNSESGIAVIRQIINEKAELVSILCEKDESPWLKGNILQRFEWTQNYIVDISNQIAREMLERQLFKGSLWEFYLP